MRDCKLFRTPATLLVLLGGIALATACLAGDLPHDWSQSFGDVDYQAGYDVTADGAGDVIMTGAFQGSVDFGGGLLTSAGGHDIFLVKFDKNGYHEWSQRFGDADEQGTYAVAVTADRDGNIIITGQFQGTMDFGGGTLTCSGSDDIFLAKFDPSGDHVWSQRFGDGGFQAGHCVAADSDGNVIITGPFNSSVDFGGGTMTSAGSFDIFLAKFDPSGNHLWSQPFGDAHTQGDWFTTIAADGDRNIIITGDFYSSVDFGGGVLTSAGGRDIFLAKLDPDGNHLWSQCFGDQDDQHNVTVAADHVDNIIITGAFLGSVDFGGGLLTSAGAYDIFLAKFDPSGNHLWSQPFGESQNQGGYAVAIDGQGYIIITGLFEGSVDFGGGLLTSAGDWDIFLAKFTPSGSHYSSRRFGDAADQSCWSIAADGACNVIITGEFAGSVDFGGGPMECVGQQDIFLAKFSPAITDVAEIPLPQVVEVWAYPNPFNPLTTIHFTLAGEQHVKLSILDVTGKRLATLAAGKYDAGEHAVKWSGTDAMGRAMPSGTYFVRLEAGSGVEARKVVLVR